MARIEGTDIAALSQREGPVWELLSGRRPRFPVAQYLGETMLWVDPDEGACAIEYPAKPELTNPAGVVHGGMMATMLDNTMSMALRITFQEGERPATIEMKINYIRPAIGTLVGEGRVIRRGRSIAFTAGELRNAEGEIVTTASATFSIQPAR